MDSTLEFLLLTALNVGSVSIFIVLSFCSGARWLRGFVLHPYFFVAIVLLIYILDFVFLFQDALAGTATTLRQMEISSASQVVFGYYIFSSATISLALGAVLFFLAPKKRKMVERSKPDQNPPLSWRIGMGRKLTNFHFHSLLSLVIALVGLGAAFLLLPIGTPLLSLTASRQLYFVEHPILHFLLGLNLPAAIFLIAVGSRRNVLFWSSLALHAANLVLLGGRGALLYIAFAWLVRDALYGRKVRALASTFLVPLGFFALSVTRYLFRDRITGIGFGGFLSAEGGIFRGAFSGLEVSMSHTLATIASLYPDFLRRWPLESMVGFFAYLIPRSMWNGKPLGASTEFSMFVHPDHWAAHRSETVISGFGDAYLMFGASSAAVWIAVGFLLGLLLGKMNGRTKMWQYLFVVYACIFLLVLVRSDFYNLAPLFWAFAVYSSLFYLLSHITRGIAQHVCIKHPFAAPPKIEKCNR